MISNKNTELSLTEQLSNSNQLPTLNIPSYTPPSEYVAPEYVAPADYVAPEYVAPTYDESKIDTLTQKRSAAGLRSARQALQRVAGGYYENPNVKRMTLRDALAGYGLSVENVISGASQQATNEYNTKYGMESEAAKINYNADVEEGKIKTASAQDEAKTKYNALVEQGKINAANALEASKTNYNATVNKLMTEYQTQLSNYMAKMYGTGVTKYGAYAQSQEEESPSSTPAKTWGRSVDGRWGWM